MTDQLDTINMISGFDVLRRNGELLDFKIRVGRHEFQAHKQLLAAMSEYFRAMFSHNTLERKKQEATLEDIEPETMKAVLDFCYTGKSHLTSDNVTEILMVASRLQIATLQNICCRHIENGVDDDNCLSALSLANRINLRRLVDVTLAYCCANFKTIVAKPEFLLIDSVVLGLIISDDRLAVDKESKVLDAVLRWTKHELSKRRQNLDNLLPLVRFALLDPGVLIGLGDDDLLRDSPTAKRLMDDAKSYRILKDQPESELVKAQIKSVEARINTVPRQNMPKRQAAVTEKYFYVIGGLSDHPSNSQILKYDRASLSWTTGEINVRVSSFGCATLNGSVYLIGGLIRANQKSSLCWRIDLESSECHEDVACMETARSDLRAVAMDGFIYAMGGQDNSSRVISLVERYNPKSRKWSRCPDLPKPLYSFGATVHKGKIYIAGGRSFGFRTAISEVYRMNSNGKWQHIAPLRVARANFSLCSCRGVLYAIGGDRGSYRSSLEYYDEDDGIWRLGSPMRRAYESTEAIVVDGLIYAVGSYPERNRESFAESYNPETKEWTVIAPLPKQVCESSLATLYVTEPQPPVKFCTRVLAPARSLYTWLLQGSLWKVALKIYFTSLVAQLLSQSVSAAHRQLK